MKFILTWVLTALAVSVALYVVPGISFVGTQWVAVFATALVLSLVNASVKPVPQLLSLPITCLTLGVFALVLNAALLGLTSWLSVNLLGTGIVIDGFGSALLGTIVIGLASALVNALTGGLARD